MTQSKDPIRLLLASDMSARCDRALDRAAQLAQQWDGELLVVHAVDPSATAQASRFARTLPSWRQPEQWTATVTRRLQSDLQEEGVSAQVQVVEDTPASAVLDAAQQHHVAMIIGGIAKDDPIGRIQLGSTVDRLVREAHAPVLTVRRRVHGPYRHVVLATDFSPASRAALNTAVRWFGDCKLSLFHAYPSTGAGLGGEHLVEDTWRAVAAGQCDTFLKESGLGTDVSLGISLILERGHPEVLLPDYVRFADVDLVILGTNGRSGLLKALLGSTAENLLHTLDCDTMVVRPQ
ncbi:MAG: universal stress protein [Aquabacterium sp.]|uniref:universal stress protein n=1 Tax=Aquabacterium sp. TaxID=1872578 RepID=UPI00271E6384|nr:universal stress protein [Aquabacterium sp.]MDO9004479.1 universal stress protein [Aquabacterium sp.]